jgi:ribonucleotide monophosphatase NagD (HAD superfamily)
MKQKVTNFDYVFIDLDGVLKNHESSEDFDFVDKKIRRMLKHIPKERLGVITNNPVAWEQLNSYGLDKYVNPELVFQSYEVARELANELIEKEDFLLLSHLDDVSKKIYSSSSDIYASLIEDVVTKKPGVYMFNKAIEKTGADPSKCLMIGDTYEDIMGGYFNGWKTLYLKGLEHDHYCTVDKLGLEPDYVVDRSRIGDLETILFSAKGCELKENHVC